MFRIVIYYGAQTQTLRLHKELTAKGAVETLRRFYRSDVIGFDLIELWKDDKLIYSKERLLCD